MDINSQQVGGAVNPNEPINNDPINNNPINNNPVNNNPVNNSNSNNHNAITNVDANDANDANTIDENGLSQDHQSGDSIPYPIYPNIPRDRPWLDTYERYNIVPTLDRPSHDSSLLELFEQKFTEYADRVAYTCMGTSLTYTELEQYSRRLAVYLQSLGLAQGSKVAIMMPNLLLYPVISLAVIRAGMVLVNINHLYTSRELEQQLNNSDAQALFLIENYAKNYQDISGTVALKHLIVCSMGDMLGKIKGRLINAVARRIKKQVNPYTLPNSISFSEALSGIKAENYQRPQLRLNDIALIQYTGGTTGISKGAMLTHGNLVANLLQIDIVIAAAFENRTAYNDVMLIALPLSHVFSFMICGLYTLHIGGTGLLIPNPSDIDALIKALNKYKPAYIPAVNTLFRSLMQHEDFADIDFSNLKLAFGGSTLVASDVAHDWHKATGLPIIEGYGLAETSPLATFNPPTISEYTGKIGIPTADTDIILIDNAGNEVALRERGEICIKGPQVMVGYHNRPDEMQGLFTQDGYLKTGDIGIMDEKGFIKIVDRKKDMILVSGFNVYPNEVEMVMSAHPQIIDCAVIGIPSTARGEEPKIYVVKEGDISEEAILDYGKRHLTSYKRPRHVQFVERLPRSNTGKLLRRELRKMEGLA